MLESNSIIKEKIMTEKNSEIGMELTAIWPDKDNPDYVSKAYICSPEEFLYVVDDKHGKEKITSVHVFPLNFQEKTVLFTQNPRGIDIIGGHIEPDEKGMPNYAIIREAFEEGGINIFDFTPVLAVRVDNSENPKALEKGYPQIGYQLFGVTLNYEMVDMPEGTECVGRQWVPLDKIKEVHHDWLSAHEMALKHALKYAEKPYVEESPRMRISRKM